MVRTSRCTRSLLALAVCALVARCASGSVVRSRTLGARRAPISRARAEWSAVPAVEPSSRDQEFGAAAAQSETVLARAVRVTVALWNFTRPHTLIGSALCIPALHLFAAPAGVALPWASLARSIGFVLLPSLLINVYIVGLNQLLDIEADKINKPYLPLASGALSRAQGVGISLFCLATGLGIGLGSTSALASRPLKATLLGSTLLGTAYSLPPLRLKRFPLMASFCITAVRGALVNWGFFTHAASVVYGLGAPSSSPAAAAAALRCACATSFFLLFGVVIALLKDIPDVAGDEAVGTATYSLRFGRQKVFGVATGLLQFAFFAVALGLGMAAFSGLAAAGAAPSVAGAAAAGSGAAALIAGRRVVGAAMACAFALAVRTAAKKVRVEVPQEVYAFYMKCWALFYASYGWLPLAR